MQPTTVRVIGSLPLVRGGLARVARRAGLVIVDAAQSADITLRCPDEGTGNATIDVAAEADRVRITIDGLPDPQTWGRLHALLVELSAGRP